MSFHAVLFSVIFLIVFFIFDISTPLPQKYLDNDHIFIAFFELVLLLYRLDFPHFIAGSEDRAFIADLLLHYFLFIRDIGHYI